VDAIGRACSAAKWLTRLLFRFEPAAVRTMLVGAVADGHAELGAFAPTLREQL